MKKFVQSHPVASFIFVTFFYSWTLWLLMILSARDLLPFRFPTNFLGSFGPLAGAFFTTAVIKGWKGLKQILISMVSFRSSLSSYLFSIFFIILIYALTSVITFLLEPEFFKSGSIPSAQEMVIYFFLIAVVGGPLGEETGWRGFLQPELMRRFSPAKTSLIIATIWLVWHLPLFWLEGAAQEGNSILYFAVSVIAMSFLFTWLYLKTKGSLFFAILFHTMINYVSAYILPTVLPQSEAGRTFGHISTLLILLSSALFLIIWYKEYTGKKDLTFSVA